MIVWCGRKSLGFQVRLTQSLILMVHLKSNLDLRAILPLSVYGVTFPLWLGEWKLFPAVYSIWESQSFHSLVIPHLR